MAWVDVIILGIAGTSILFGLFRGAIRTVFSIVGVVVGFLVATRESGAVGVVLSNWMPERTAAVVGFLFVFLGIAVVFALVAWLLRKLLEGLALTWIDRLAGGIFGFLRGALIVGVFALVLEALEVKVPDDSISYPWALGVGEWLLEIVPEDTLDRLDWGRLKGLIPDSAEGFI